MAGAATVPVLIAKTATPQAVTATTADTVQFKNNDTVTHKVAFKPTTGVNCSPSPFALPAGQTGTCTSTPAGAVDLLGSHRTGTTFARNVDRDGAAGAGHADAVRTIRNEVVYSSKIHADG